MKKQLLTLIFLASSAFAQAETYSLNFQMPSSNVICGGDLPADEANGKSAWHGVACTMVTPLVLPKNNQSEQCSYGWGYEFVLPESGAAERPCHSHLPVQYDAPVLKYGAEIRGNGWACKSEYSGLTCSNQDGSGFKLRKSEQILFAKTGAVNHQQTENPQENQVSQSDNPVQAAPDVQAGSEIAMPE